MITAQVGNSAPCLQQALQQGHMAQAQREASRLQCSGALTGEMTLNRASTAAKWLPEALLAG
jgi:hypothetical protein